MANRAMTAKVERARRQTRELAMVEYSKPFYVGNATLGAAEARRAELARLCDGYKGKVHYGRTKSAPVERKRGGWSDRSLILPGTAQRAGIRYAHSNVSALIVAAR